MQGSTRRVFSLCGAGLGALLSGSSQVNAQAQAPTPARYQVRENYALVAPGQVLTVTRDGDRATLEQFMPPGAVGPEGSHSRAYYDLKSKTSHTIDLLVPTMACGPSNFSGDWGDPFVQSADLMGQMAGLHPTDLGPKTINGIATLGHEAKTPDAVMDIWTEPKTGLIVKWIATPSSGPPKVMIEVTSLSLTPPSAESLALPAKCRP